MGQPKGTTQPKSIGQLVGGMTILSGQAANKLWGLWYNLWKHWLNLYLEFLDFFSTKKSSHN